MRAKSVSNRSLFAKKSLGQNFLIDPEYIDKIISAVSPAQGDIIIEIGPGRGALTQRLAVSGARVIAIELDQRLVPALERQFSALPNAIIVEGDVLEADFEELIGDGQAKLVANLPFNISTAILQRLAGRRAKFSELVLMFQKEVVDRLTALPANSERGFLTVIVEACFETEKLFDVPPEAFLPVPKVFSSVIRLRPKAFSVSDFERFRSVVSLAFAQKRKTILNNLKPHFENAADLLIRAGIAPSRRAESLSLDEWVELVSRCER